MKKVFSFAVLCLLAVPGFAGKEIPEPPEKVAVGEAHAYSVTPVLVPGSEGRATWSHTVHEREAGFLKVHFRDFNLHPGDVLRIFSGSGRLVETLRDRGPKELGNFWSLSAFGETLILDLETRNDYPQPPFVIDRMIVGDAAMLEPARPWNAPESVCAPADFEDVVCYQGDGAKWSNIYASVGLMNAGNTGPTLWCSGSNVSPQDYLLTNQHCIEDQSDCDGTEFVFKYYRTGCNNGAPVTGDWVSYRCDEVVAQSPYNGFCDPNLNNLDFTLASVLVPEGGTSPSSLFGYVTPDPTPLTDGEAIYIVQHPNGRPHEVAHGDGADVDVDGTTLRYYDTLDTEGGSSGSPIFRDADDKMVGLHHCGGCSDPGVGNRGMLMSDIYPHIETFLCTPGLTLTAAGGGNPVEVLGNGNGIMEPAETWEFTPTVRNGACSGDALAVEADIEVNGSSAAVSLGSTVVSFGTIPAGQTAAASAPVQFVVGDSTCGEDVILDLVDIETSSAAGPFDDQLAYVESPVGGTLYTTLWSEDFGSGLGSWTIVDGGTGTGPAQTWTTADPGGRNLLSPPFAIVDSDEHGSGLDMDEELISPIIDASATFETLELRFAHNFRYYSSGGAEQADVDVKSTATAGVWTNVANYSGADASGTVTLPIDAFGANDLQLRFHYHDATYDWWWAVDDVTILGGEAICESFDGSLFEDGFESGDTTGWD